MENLPEDQRDEDSSSPEPEPIQQEQALEVLEGALGVAALNIQQPLGLEIVQNVQPALLLRHASVSSLVSRPFLNFVIHKFQPFVLIHRTNHLKNTEAVTALSFPKSMITDQFTKTHLILTEPLVN